MLITMPDSQPLSQRAKHDLIILSISKISLTNFFLLSDQIAMLTPVATSGLIMSTPRPAISLDRTSQVQLMSPTPFLPAGIAPLNLSARN